MAEKDKYYSKSLRDWTWLELCSEYAMHRRKEPNRPSAWQADKILEEIAYRLSEGTTDPVPIE